VVVAPLPGPAAEREVRLGTSPRPGPAHWGEAYWPLASRSRGMAQAGARTGHDSRPWHPAPPHHGGRARRGLRRRGPRPGAGGADDRGPRSSPVVVVAPSPGAAPVAPGPAAGGPRGRRPASGRGPPGRGRQWGSPGAGWWRPRSPSPHGGRGGPPCTRSGPGRWCRPTRPACSEAVAHRFPAHGGVNIAPETSPIVRTAHVTDQSQKLHPVSVSSVVPGSTPDPAPPQGSRGSRARARSRLPRRRAPTPCAERRGPGRRSGLVVPRRPRRL